VPYVCVCVRSNRTRSALGTTSAVKPSKVGHASTLRLCARVIACALATAALLL
jgi:hypothetical protein